MALNANGQNYIQNFKEEIAIESFPSEFLPGWYGNEIRSTSARIFQSDSEGRNGSTALGVQPISTFDGIIFVRLSADGFENPKVQFWAKSLQNGSGDRAAEVYSSWSEDLNGEYSSPEIIGSTEEFPNRDQEYRKYQLSPPEDLLQEDELFLKLEIRYGEGSGTCARLILDDFEFGDIEEDVTPPEVAEVLGYDEAELLVSFNESLDPVFSEFQINYQLNGLEPSAADLVADSLIRLQFDEALEPGNEYELRITQIPDLDGNFLTDTLIVFQFFDPTHIPSKTLVINEIMPAPRPDLDLPNVEYVELFHTGAYSIRMENLIWANSRSEVLLEELWVDPGEYLLLIPINSLKEMEGFGKVLPVNSWQTLLNGGDELELRDDQGKLIDRIAYTSGSWESNDLAGGGYSLEVKNPYLACEQGIFLVSSTDQFRGTPGRQNSGFDLTPDEDPPKIISDVFVGNQQVEFEFSEPIVIQPDLLDFEFSPELPSDSIYPISPTRLRVELANPAEENKVYSVQLEGITDCSGNDLDQSEALELILPAQAGKADIGINEVLFNSKTGTPKFVELANMTDKYLEIGNWKLANLNDNGDPDQLRDLNDGSLIIEPGGFLAFTTDEELLRLTYDKAPGGKMVELPSLPSYPIGGGTVVLISSEGEVVEQFDYSEDLHHPLLRDAKGVSLERLSLDSPTDLAFNWQSASGVVGYATPGLKNSQLVEDEFSAELIQIDPEIFDPEGSNGNTFTTIRYQLDQSGWIGTFRVYAISGQLIQILAQNEILGTSGLFTWTGTSADGKIVRPGYYVLLVELFDQDGQVKTIKKTIVVATKL